MSRIVLAQQAVDPATPAAGQIVVYARTNDLLYLKNDDGNTAQVGGAQPAIRTIGVPGSSVTNGEVVFANANGISFGLAGSTITAKVPSVSYFENQGGNPVAANLAANASGASNVSVQRFSVPNQISATRLDYLAHLTVAGSTAFSSTMRAVVYTFAGSTANSLFSASATMSHSSGTAATSSTNAYGGQSGTRWRSMAIGTWNLTPGEYLIAFVHSGNGPGGTTGSVSIYGKSNVSILPMAGGAAVTHMFKEGLAPASSAPPASIHLTALNQTAASAAAQPYFRLVGSF